MVFIIVFTLNIGLLNRNIERIVVASNNEINIDFFNIVNVLLSETIKLDNEIPRKLFRLNIFYLKDIH